MKDELAGQVASIGSCGYRTAMVTILVGKGSNRRSITRHLRMTGVVGEFADRDGRLYLDYGIKGLGLVVGKLPKKPKAEKVVAESEK